MSNQIPTYLNVLKSIRHDVDEYYERVAECTQCTLCSMPQRPKHSDVRTVFRGNLPCELLLVFPAPRRIDVLSDSPLRGLEGSIIDEVIEVLLRFYPRLRVALTTAVHCYPYDTETDHRDPTKAEIHTCYHANLTKFMEIANPSIVALFGEVVKKNFPRVDSRRYVTIRHPTNAIRAHDVDSYKREVFNALDTILETEGAVFCCNKPARFTPKPER